MLLLLMTGMTLWYIYGLVIGELPVILANGITLILVAAITTMKIRFP